MNEFLKTFVIFALTAAVFIFCGGVIKYYVWTPAVQDNIRTAPVSTGSTARSADTGSGVDSNKNKDISEMSLEESLDLMSRTRIESNTMMIPAELIDDNTYAVFESLAGQGEFQDFEVREDGYLTFPVNDDLRSYMVGLTSTEIDEVLQQVSAEQSDLHIRSITANDSYTEFTVYTELNDASAEDEELDLLLFTLGKFYYNMSGEPVNNFTVIYRNADTNEQLAVRHSAV